MALIRNSEMADNRSHTPWYSWKAAVGAPPRKLKRLGIAQERHRLNQRVREGRFEDLPIKPKRDRSWLMWWI
jgi:hypothetical protein